MPNTAPIRADIDWADPHGGEPWRFHFAQAREVLQADHPDQVRAVLEAVHEHAMAGRWCVGAVSFEAAPAFDAALPVHPACTPLAWFAVFDEATPASDGPWAPAGSVDAHAHWPVVPEQGTERAAFDAEMVQIHEHIAAGDFYQINHTSTWHGRLCRGSALAYFDALRQAQPKGYAAHLDAGDWQLLSVSPELFFDWDGEQLLCRPMKGTAARGATPEADAAQAQALRASAKEQAENVMIVDLIRNDVSRVAQPFSVKVPRLFHLEPLPTVWQMTSDVSARTRAGVTWVDVFAALFPCGSVTGAPKVQAMHTIRDLEPGARGWYCGAIGVVRPGGAARFNVAIRTVQVQGDALRCGIGSGITTDATAEGEWREWGHKRRFLRNATEPFELLETLALDHGQLRHASQHWSRLSEAAAHFGWRWGAVEQAALQAQAQALCAAHPKGLWRVRCCVAADGQARLEAFALEASPESVQLVWAREPFAAAHSEWVRHKTTRRAHYDAATVQAPGAFDTLLYNAEGEITECVRGNIAALIDGQWLTPALHCGLLPGVGRAVALREGRVREAVIRREDAHRVQAWAFLNSLRGWLPATVRLHEHLVQLQSHRR
jgi:para-aminobenzoate synthetase / 4-amino-4-deoxychorismate lyase